MINSKCSNFDDGAKNVVDCEVLIAIPEVYGALKSFKNDAFLIKEVFEQTFTKRADHKNNIKSTFQDASDELENTIKMLQIEMLKNVGSTAWNCGFEM